MMSTSTRTSASTQRPLMNHFLYRLFTCLLLCSVLSLLPNSSSKVIRVVVHAIQNPLEGRYSFSLTTYAPNGKLPQLEYAHAATNLGPTLIAIPLPHLSTQLIITIQSKSLPSPLITNDGTSRIIPLTNTLLLSHTGLSADGRVLSAAAQRIIVEYAYTYQEPMSIQDLGMSLSSLIQEYTLKSGCRPFGSCIVLSCCETGRVFQLDPSGVVTQLVEGTIVALGRGREGGRGGWKDRLVQQGVLECQSVDDAWDLVVQVIKEELQQTEEEGGHDQDSSSSRAGGGSLMLVGGSLVLGKPFQVRKELL